MNNRLIIITALFSLFGCSMNGQNAINEDDNIVAFSFGSGGGMDRFGGFDYDITLTPDQKVHFQIDQRRPQEKEFTIDDRSVFDSLQQVIMKHKMYKYSGNYKPRTQVLDGKSWHFNVLYESGKSIDASGYMAGPDGYHEAFEELHSCLAKWKAMPVTPNEVVSFIYHYGADTYSITREDGHALLTHDNETAGLHQRLERDLEVLEEIRILFITSDLKMDSEKEEVKEGCTPWDYEINYGNGEHYQYFSADCGYKCGYTEQIQGLLSELFAE